jgi:integrase
VRPGEPTQKGQPYDVCWEDADGRKRQKRYYDDTKATKEAGRIEKALERGENTNPKAGRKTFRDVAEDWLATKQNARKDTRDRYRAILEAHAYPKQHAYPDWGRRRIASITAADVGRFVDSLYTKPDGKARPATGIARIMYPIRAVFAYALDEGCVPRNPSKKVPNPSHEALEQDPFEGIALTPQQVQALAIECEARYPFGALIVWFVALTGVRAGELNRLNIGHLKTLRNYLTVPGTKSKRSKGRRVDYSSALTMRLTPYLGAHPRANEPDAPLFYGRVPGSRHLDPQRRFDPSTFYKYTFKPAAKAVGLQQVRLHDLRHTAGSWWIEAGISLLTVSARLGHADINFTRKTYIHLLHTQAEEDTRKQDLWMTQQLKQNNLIPIPMRRTA